MKTLKHLNIKTFKHYRMGFTLIELLVTVGIIMLLMAAAIPSYNRYGAQNELYQVAQTVRTAILTTKNYAIAPFSEKSKLENYSITFQNSGSKLQYIINEKSASGTREIENTQFSDISLRSGAATIVFSVEEKGKITSPSGIIDLQLESARALSPDNMLDIQVDAGSGQVIIRKPLK